MVYISQFSSQNVSLLEMISRSSKFITKLTGGLTARHFVSVKRSVYYHGIPKNRFAKKMPGPMVWIDCEMTGLDHKEDRIIEICCLISNGKLELVDEVSLFDFHGVFVI